MNLNISSADKQQQQASQLLVRIKKSKKPNKDQNPIKPPKNQLIGLFKNLGLFKWPILWSHSGFGNVHQKWTFDIVGVRPITGMYESY